MQVLVGVEPHEQTGMQHLSISDLIMSSDFQITIHYVASSLYINHNYCWFKSILFQYSHHVPRISPWFSFDNPTLFFLWF